MCNVFSYLSSGPLKSLLVLDIWNSAACQMTLITWRRKKGEEAIHSNEKAKRYVVRKDEIRIINSVYDSNSLW